MSACNAGWTFTHKVGRFKAGYQAHRHRCHLDHGHEQAQTRPSAYHICRCGMRSDGKPHASGGWRLGEAQA